MGTVITVGTFRLWDKRTVTIIEYQSFNDQHYIDAWTNMNISQSYLDRGCLIWTYLHYKTCLLSCFDNNIMPYLKRN